MKARCVTSRHVEINFVQASIAMGWKTIPTIGLESEPRGGKVESSQEEVICES
jgi:hypothetical protein